ncbi:MAG: hypothetical protein ABSF94_17450 [Steroidobacteraceae bacterium]
MEKVRVVSTTPPTALLYAFDVGSAVLKPEHSLWLNKNMPPYLTPRRSWEPRAQLFLIGLASRTGPEEFNMSLSMSRAQNVEKALQDVARANGVDWFRAAARCLIDRRVAMGEEAARLAGMPDGVEDERYRGVLVGVGETPFKSPIGPVKMVKRRAHVKLLLKQESGKATRVFMDPQDKRGEQIANLSSEIYGVVAGADPIISEDFKTVSEVSTVVTITIEKSSLDPRGLGLVTLSFLDVDYEWADMRHACVQRKVVVKDGSQLKTHLMNLDEMNEWFNHPFRAWHRMALSL